MPAKPAAPDSPARSGAARGDLAAVIALLRQLRTSERARISSALHDQVGQFLTAAGLELEMARIDAADRNDDAAVSQLRRAASHMEEAFTRVRDLSCESHPDPVEKFGFEGALNRYLERVGRRHPNRLKTRLERPVEPRNNLAPALYEIVTTALDFALDRLYSSQVSFSTHRRPEGLRMRIRTSVAPDCVSPGATSEQQRNALEEIRELAVMCGIRASVRLDRRCATVLELHG